MHFDLRSKIKSIEFYVSKVQEGQKPRGDNTSAGTKAQGDLKWMERPMTWGNQSLGG